MKSQVTCKKNMQDLSKGVSKDLGIQDKNVDIAVGL